MSNLSPPVRPADPSPNHVTVREAVSVAAAGGHHRSRRSTSVILHFTELITGVACCDLKMFMLLRKGAGYELKLSLVSRQDERNSLTRLGYRFTYRGRS
ncbi:uncharacterized protein LOC130973785 isoform X2 [Arachis stenosperma]|uniref:uncharacterized protein LOC130973785 isoform X2 n=1 Tax=Arachis stenosperma TaxID=217475 RepID=UPI0025AC6ED7|nr:uncharacterized protein LOC130973785 isoform X2 [Arachis stenosperma]